jgi:putative cardiolipin synthase
MIGSESLMPRYHGVELVVIMALLRITGKSIPRALAITATLLFAGGCASIDFNYPREPSMSSMQSEHTSLGRTITPLVLRRPGGYSGFRPLADGIDALSYRLLLAERAEQSIDVQYYLIKNDFVGRVFTHALLQAADRGVRVRVLLDDVFTKGYDAGMAALDGHENVEVRIFNPFYRGAAGRVVSAATGFTRVNRRMHNKSFIVDHQITIIGGRNIADEYFGAREDSKFGDLDVVGIGPIVDEVATMFDSYWNHETALPVPAFIRNQDTSEAARDRLRESLAATVERAKTSRYAEAILDRIIERLDEREGSFTWAPYELVYDLPDKGVRTKSVEAGSIVMPLADAMTAATREVMVVSPYFVPRKRGIEVLSDLRARGVDVTIITNSLAANNQFTVHSGYVPSRKPLLRAGVEIYEVRPDAEVRGTEYVDASEALTTLHTKAFIVDRERVFIGSFNFDPRSANINTEMGVIIDDPELATTFADRIEQALPTQTYSVFLNEDGKLRWRGVETVYKKEPQTSWWQRFRVNLVRMFPVRGQL